MHFDVPFESLFGQSRKFVFARPRQVAMYLCRQLGGRSYPVIGQYFAGRDHTTALHASQTIGKQAVVDDELLRDIVTVAAIASGLSMDRNAYEREWVQILRPRKPRAVIKKHWGV